MSVITFPYECDEWQKRSFQAIDNDNDLLICVPTSGGKTTVATLYKWQKFSN